MWVSWPFPFARASARVDFEEVGVSPQRLENGLLGPRLVRGAGSLAGHGPSERDPRSGSAAGPAT